jgi:hypothetical protein
MRRQGRQVAELTVEQLKRCLRERDLPVSGRKRDLIQRLEAVGTPQEIYSAVSEELDTVPGEKKKAKIPLPGYDYDGPLIKIACSEVAALTGNNPFAKRKDAWKRLCKKAFPEAYNKMRSHVPEFATPDDKFVAEVSKLEPRERMHIHNMITKASRETDHRKKWLDREEIDKVSKGRLSAVSRQVMQTRVLQRRGTREESEGLDKFQEKQEKESVMVAKKIMTKVKNIEKEEEKPEPKTERIKAAREEKIQKLKEEVVELTQEKTILKSPIRRKVVAKTRPTQRFSAEMADGLILSGLVDAARSIEGPEFPVPEMHIIEHKARQRKLFKQLRKYEEIQCLGYIHLVKQDRKKDIMQVCEEEDRRLRCFLVETFEDDSWRCEVDWDEDYWQGTIVDMLREKTDSLRALLYGNPEPNDVRRWFDEI